MKKCIWFVLAASLAVGCTSKEDDAQIKAFWAQQSMHVMEKFPAVAMAGALAAQKAPAFNQADAEEEFVSLAESENGKEPTPQEMEEMLKQWQDTQNQLNETVSDTTLPDEQTPSKDTAMAQQSQPATPVAPQAENKAPAPRKHTSAKTQTSTVTTPKTKPIEALLVVSSTCGWCKRLKQDRWAEKFKDKYWGQVKLIEYDVNTATDRTLLNKYLRKHKLTSVGTPTLFVADTVIRGYPLTGADEAVQKALAKQGVSAPAGTYMEITMEEPAGPVKGKAPLKDRQAMQRAIEKVQQDNENALSDIGQMFGNATQAQAAAIMSKTEKALRQKANASASLQAYLAAQKQLLAQQEQNLNKLMQENARFIRDIR